MHTGGDAFELRVRTVPQRTLAVISREVFQPELAAFIDGGFTALFAFAAAQPGIREDAASPDWPTFAIYHGPVAPHVRARVDLCALVADTAQPREGIELRAEPEHDEAYVALTKSQIVYPRILDAYAAVAGWVADRGHLVKSLPPREVYVTDVRRAAAHDLVCEVAVPYAPRP